MIPKIVKICLMSCFNAKANIAPINESGIANNTTNE
jgi:hypothetical protein